MEEEDFSKLPVEEACVHKVWKARLSGYEAAAKQFELIEDEKSNEWNKFISLMKKFVIDSHALCQEKGLEAVLIFVENCGAAGRTTADVVSGIIQKCLAAPKARTKELGAQVILMYIEIEKYEVVIDEILKGTESKNPKVTAACVHVLFQALREFGPKVINTSKVLKRVPALIEDRDQFVRQETKTLVAEMIHWLGPVVKQQLAAVLKPPQISEIDNEYEKVKSTPAKASRLLRSQQAKKAVLQTGHGVTAEDEPDEGGVLEEADPFELLEAVDILAQLNKDFYPKLESKKWVERKEALEELEKLLQKSPKLENGDYGEILRALKKVVQKDSNIVVVVFAIKGITGIASGLKKKFHQYAASIMPILFEKFKEKKQNVVLALRDAVDAVYASTTLESLQEDILLCLDNKNPNIKSEICSFLTRCFSKSTPNILTKKLLKPLCKGLTNGLRDQDQNVRDASALALGTAMKVVGEKAMGPFLVDIDAQIMKKIKENYVKAEVVVFKPPVQKQSKPSKAISEDSVKRETRQVKSAHKSQPVEPLSIAAHVTSEIKLIERDEALNLAQNILGDDIYNGMFSADEKEQIASCEKLKEHIKGMPESGSSEMGQAFLALVSAHNFTVPDELSIAKIEVLKAIAEKFTLPCHGMEEALYNISDHFARLPLVSEMLTTYAKSTSLEYVTNSILPCPDKIDQEGENLPLLPEKLNWLSSGLMKTDIINDPAYFFELGKKASVHSNALIRNAGLALIGTVHLKTNTGKPKASQEKIKAAVGVSEGRKTKKDTSDKESSKKQLPSSESEHSTSSDMDIGTKLSESILSELADKNWKVRAEAVQKVQGFINSAKSINGNLGEAAPLIAARIHDSNAKICASAIALVESIAPAMGVSCKRYIPVFLPALMKALGDQKIWIRSAVVPCLNTWGDVCGYENFFVGEVVADALRSGTVAARTELWAWLAVKLPEIPVKSFPKEELSACLSVLYSNFEDRHGDVRRNACDAALGVMLHLGYNNMVQAIDNIKGSGCSARVIKDILDKTRGNLPIPVLAKSKSVTLVAEKPAGRSGSVKPLQSSTILPKTKQKASISGSKSLSSFRGKKEEEDTAPLLPINSLKNQRFIDEQKLKILKWSFITPRPEFVELLKDLMNAASINKTFISYMFHPDFKYHLQAIDLLVEDLPTNRDGLKCNLDLILKWMTLRFFDTNPSVLLRGLEYLQSVFSMLIDDEYSLSYGEVTGFLPYLIIKAGESKDAVRNSVRALLKQMASIYPPNKQFMYLMEGVKSKNARQRAECLDQVNWLIENCGLTVCHPNTSTAMKDIAKLIADRDNTVRNAALNCVVTAQYLGGGDKIMKMVGQISEKDMTLLEERVRRAAKNRPLVAVKPLTSLESITTTPSLVSLATEEVHHGEVEEQIVERIMPVENPEVFKNTASISIQTIEPQTRPRPHTAGAFGFDRTIVEDIECTSSQFNAPKLVDIDLQFLKESSQASFKPIQLPKVTPTLSSYSRPSAIKRELLNITNPDIERAMSSVARIDLIISSAMNQQLIEYTDQLATQLVQLIVILNESAHPEVVNCYNATFSLLMKICSNKDFCSQISEGTLYNIIEQFLILLTEPRLDTDQNMFGRVVNNLIIRFLENSNKTNVMCALLKLIHACVSEHRTSVHFKELVVKCLWKLHRSQAEWDSELDYCRVLTEFDVFLKEFPTAWWKNEEFDLPLRTVKTVLHSMVKIRGVKVREIVDKMPNISKDSELYAYIKRVIKHLKVEQNVKDTQSIRESQPSRENILPQESNVSTGSRLTKEQQAELSGIFRLIGDVDETAQGMKRLFTFMKTHPDTNVEPFLSKTNPQFQQYIKRGLQALEECEVDIPEINKKESTNTSETCLVKQKESFTEEAEILWTKLKSIKEMTGCEKELKFKMKNIDEIPDTMTNLEEERKENTQTEMDLELLKKHIEKMKSMSKP